MTVGPCPAPASFSVGGWVFRESLKGGNSVEGRGVLVIDDEQVVLGSVSRILTGRNYQVDVSPSGRNGLRKAIEGEYDAEYLEKPFTPEELLKTVASALDTIFTREPEERDLIHREESIEVLERAASGN